MLDFGWAELLIIVAVAVFVIGPKDIPNIMYGLGRVVRRLQYMKYAVSQQFDDLMQASDIDELRRGVNFEAKRSEDEITQEREEDEDLSNNESGGDNDKPAN
jgi:sec-independent protein translocase protein TatB